jgi:hypothetical protein
VEFDSREGEFVITLTRELCIFEVYFLKLS